MCVAARDCSECGLCVLAGQAEMVPCWCCDGWVGLLYTLDVIAVCICVCTGMAGKEGGGGIALILYIGASLDLLDGYLSFEGRRTCAFFYKCI